jgi:hypothetical protein
MQGRATSNIRDLRAGLGLTILLSVLCVGVPRVKAQRALAALLLER